MVVYTSITTWATLKLGFVPSPQKWGKITGQKFREIFGFSRDLFVLQIATQCISASQIVLVSRLIGLDAAAVWSVCTKSFTLAQQIVFKIYEFSVPGFSEMVVRGDIARFRERLATIISITAVAAGLFAILGAFGNRTLVSYWTGGKVSWNQWADVCAAVYLFSTCITRCYTGITGVLKRIGYFKYISLLEGVVVVLGSIWLAPSFHFVGVFLSAILANLICSGLYGVKLVAKRFDIDCSTVTLGWLSPALRFARNIFLLSGSHILDRGQFLGVVPFVLTAVFAGVAGFDTGVPCRAARGDSSGTVIIARTAETQCSSATRKRGFHGGRPRIHIRCCCRRKSHGPFETSGARELNFEVGN